MLGLFNLSQNLDDDKLRELLEKYGKLEKLILIKDRMVTAQHTHTIHNALHEGEHLTHELSSLWH